MCLTHIFNFIWSVKISFITCQLRWFYIMCITFLVRYLKCSNVFQARQVKSWRDEFEVWLINSFNYYLKNNYYYHICKTKIKLTLFNILKDLYKRNNISVIFLRKKISFNIVFKKWILNFHYLGFVNFIVKV